MTSLILRTTIRYMFPLLGLFSVFLFLRGHDHPGGGFIAGSLGAAAVALCAYAYGAERAESILRADPRWFIGVGLSIILASGLWAWGKGQPFLTASWTKWSVPGFGKVEIGTPLVFDLGIYFAVFGGISLVLLQLAERTR